MRSHTRREQSSTNNFGARVRVVRLCLLVMGVIIIGRLFFLQVIHHQVYAALSVGQHDFFQNLFPERGEIVIMDRLGKVFPLATNQDLYLL